MKHVVSLSAALLCAITLFTSCDKIQKLMRINVEASSSQLEFEIPIVDSGNMSRVSASEYINIDSIIKANDASLNTNDIKSAIIQSCTFEMEDQDVHNNFANLESCKVTLSSDTREETVTLAERQNNPDSTAYSMTIPVNQNVNLKDYFGAKVFSYNLSAQVRRAITSPIHCKAIIRYKIEAGAAGS